MSEQYCKRKLYLEITTDKYQLPLIVCDSPTELARRTGKSQDNINGYIYHAMHGKYKYPRFISVEVDDNEEM